MAIRNTIGDWVSRGRWRIHLLFVLLFVPIAVFAYSVGRLLRHQAENHAQVESTQIVRGGLALVQEDFEEDTAFLQSIAASAQFRAALVDGDRAEMERHLAEARSLSPDFNSVGAFRLDGNLLAIYPDEPSFIDKSFAFRDWYKGVTRKWTPYVSEIFQSTFSHQLGVAIAIPIRDDARKPIGIVRAVCPVNTIGRELFEGGREGSWTVMLVDQYSHLAGRHDIDPYSPAPDLSNYEPVKRMRAGNSGYGMFMRDGNIFAVRYEAVPRYGWGILVEQPTSALHESVGLVERRVWMLAVVFLGVGLIMSAFLGSLYSELESGNRFINLSADLFCVGTFEHFFKRINPAWEKALGFTRQELMAKSYMDFMHPEDREATLAEISRIVAPGTASFAFENRFLCKDGSVKWLSWNAVSVPEQRVNYAVARDITARKQVEAELRKKGRAASAVGKWRPGLRHFYAGPRRAHRQLEPRRGTHQGLQR
jgi:PAS domain S-box-containing protein